MKRAVLLVEPRAQHRADLQAMLASSVYHVVGEACDPEEAMRLAAMRTPDVAIVAEDLGKGHGVHLAGRLATELAIPAILVASTSAPTAILRATQGGVMGFLVQPVNPATLSATLELAVARFQQILALRRDVEGLRRTLEARKLIERAKGLLMEMEDIPEEEAFGRLRQKSMDTQRPMAEIARAIILAAEVSGRTR